ncbi:MAG TPA: tripartite tricarboxylate transporter substrate binding protein [Hyphomicrobiaceae bacterium]|jgi:tripartite-type tricarboxylate transporter receptor subunit TctC|nr:tripartite tricarboxylate transporter substrate binding protein [Hyphomicrobiaceae bacterium]
MSYLRRIGLALALAGTVAGPAGAQSYPERAVKIIVPFGAGGPADIYARYVADQLQKAWNQSFVVEARPGAGSFIGTSEVAKAAPDGYTLLMMSNTHTVNETLRPSRPFNLMRDFVGIAPVNYSDLIMVVHPSVPANDLKEFLALAKSKPGALNYASSGLGTPYHMAGELFKAMSGTDIVHVPHKASGDARTAVLGGHVQMMIDAITTTAPTVQGGQVRALGTTGKARSDLMPDVPTIAEAGVPGYEATIWLGLMAPTGTPQPVVDKLNAEVNKVLARSDTKEAWAKQGAVPLVMSPAEFDTYLRADIDKWADVIQKAGIKPVQ